MEIGRNSCLLTPQFSPPSTQGVHSQYTQNPKLPDAELPQRGITGGVRTGKKTQKPYFQFEK
jgi:hypothetical protein